jgi:hypothetical protein
MVFIYGFSVKGLLEHPVRRVQITHFPLSSVSRPTLGPTQPLVQLVPGVLSSGVKRCQGVTLTTHPHLVPRAGMSRKYTSHPCGLHGGSGQFYFDLLIMLIGWYVSEPRAPMSLLSIPLVICERGEPRWWWSCWWWWCRLGKTPNSSTRALWQSYQQRRLGASRLNGWRSENFAYQYLWYVNRSLTCRKVLRHGTSGFTSHLKAGVLRIITL